MMKEGEYFEEEEEEDEQETPEETQKPEQKEEFILHYERLCRGETSKVGIARSGQNATRVLWKTS